MPDSNGRKASLVLRVVAEHLLGRWGSWCIHAQVGTFFQTRQWTMTYIPSGKLTCLWKITIFNGKINYK